MSSEKKPDYILKDVRELNFLTQRSIENEGSFLLPLLKQGMRVLDLGCGPGSITLGFSKYVGDSGKVAGIDMDVHALEIARKSALDHELKNVEFVEGKITELPFPDSSFDMVFMNAVLVHTFSIRHQIYKEVKRVLTKDGEGLFAIRDIDSTASISYPPSDSVETTRQILSHLIEFNGGEPSTGRRLREQIAEIGLQEIHFGCDSQITKESDSKKRMAFMSKIISSEKKEAEFLQLLKEKKVIPEGTENLKQFVEPLMADFEKWASDPHKFTVSIWFSIVGKLPK